MKIVHVVEAWKGGIASYVQALANAQLRDGHTVTIVTDQQSFEEDLRQLNTQLTFYRSSRNPLKFWRIAKDLREKLTLIDPDVIHCHSTFPGVYCRISKRLYQTFKLIYSPHGWAFYKQDIGAIRRLLYKKVETFLSSNCHIVLCTSFQECRSAQDINIEKGKIRIVHTGIEPAVQEAITSSPPNAPLKIGFFGRLDFQKGYDVLHDALDKISGSVEVHVFGTPVRAKELRRHAKASYHGWLPAEDVYKKMLAMDVIVIPSRWEGFALTPLIAMQAGKAIIVSNESSLSEVVIHRYNGIVLPNLTATSLADAINQLTVADCQDMGENGRQIYEKSFKLDSYYTEMDDLYRNLVLSN